MTLIKNNYFKIVLGVIIALPLFLGMTAHAATVWDTTGSYQVAFNYLGSDYGHDMTLVQSTVGALTGNGGSPIGANTYTWVITSGTVTGDAVDFYANYTATVDAVTPQTTMHVVGTIAPDGTLSGTWTDNYQGGERGGTWKSTNGVAHELKSLPLTEKKQCKKGGWKTFTDPLFKNQGRCVSFVEHLSHGHTADSEARKVQKHTAQSENESKRSHSSQKSQNSKK